METNVRMYRFSRGEKYQCIVKIEEGLVVFGKMVYPPATKHDVVAKLMEDAEREAMKIFSKVKEG